MSDARAVISLIGGFAALTLVVRCLWTGNPAYGICAIALALLFRDKF